MSARRNGKPSPIRARGSTKLILALASGLAALVPALPVSVRADWQPADGHKMHFPQLPDEEGWDVNATAPMVLADDWQCSATGPITDVHFWGSWRDMNGDGVGDVGQIVSFVISIHADIPASPPVIPHSRPGATLREWEISAFIPVPIDPPTLEAWYDPMTGQVVNNDHGAYFQYNITNLPGAPFIQQQGTIYWLNISANLADPVNTQWGWKSSRDHWNDDAVWANFGALNWVEMLEPPRFNTFTATFNDLGQLVSGGGTNAYGQGWYFYDQSEWWNIWFYDNPFTTQHIKQVTINLQVSPVNPLLPSFMTLAANWSTPAWSLVGNPPGTPRRPPIPPTDEAQYIDRQIIWQGMIPPGGEMLSIPYQILYNPEWVSIDLLGGPGGYNFRIANGTITHQCVGTSLDLAFVITGQEPPQACCLMSGPTPDCQDLTVAQCQALQGNPQGAGTSCTPTIGSACCISLTGMCVNAHPICCDDYGGGPPPLPALVCLGDESGNGVDDACEILDTVVCEPTTGANSTHPPTYWYDVTPTGFGRCDFHVQVFDPNPASYTNWGISPWPGITWQFLVHQVGTEWWASWWDSDPNCPNAFFVPTRFQFDHSNPSTWGDWRTTISNGSDPNTGVVDRSSNHAGELDGWGYRVHVPREAQCVPTPDALACTGPCPQAPETCVPKVIRHHVAPPFFPATAGVDTLIPTTGYVDVQDPSGLVTRFTINPNLPPNRTMIIRESPTVVGAHHEMGAEIIETQLVAEGPGGMTVFIRESPTRASTGRVVGAPSALGDYPADSFFDLFVEIDVPGMGIFEMWNQQPIPMEAHGIMAMPPLGSAYHSPPGWGGVDMLDATGMATGFRIVEAEHVPPPPPPEWEVIECQCLDPNACHVERGTGPDPICIGGCPPGEQCTPSITIIDPGATDYSCDCAAVEACCLRNGTCVETTHDACVAQGGDPQGPGTVCDMMLCNPIKHAQPPVFSPVSPAPNCFWGWDEHSHYACGGCPIMADDWLCDNDMPVSDIHWWGSYLGYTGGEVPPPGAGPEMFHIGIWTNVPAGVDQLWSHPGVMIKEWMVPRAVLRERVVGCDFYPNQPQDTCFRYDFFINDQAQWFQQEPACNIYWVSIAAWYTVAPPPPWAVWGWKTRPHLFDDDAVRILAPNPPMVGQPFQVGEPLFVDGQSWDMAFVMTAPPYVPPVIAPPPHDRRKNRYISFVPNNPGQSVAFRVARTTAPAGSCWVQTPVTAAGNDQYTATCGANPVFRIWNEPVIHVGDCEIIPVVDYTVFTNGPGPIENPVGLAVPTILLPSGGKWWGDNVGSNNGTEWTPPNGIANVNDVTSLLAFISGLAIKPHFTVANLQAISSSDPCLNAQVNASDVLIAVQAVAGATYGPASTTKPITFAGCAGPPTLICPCCGN